MIHRGARHVVVDSTGVNVYGEGEWKARPTQPGVPNPTHPRDQILQRIEQVGRAAWKQESGYHRRSLAETTLFRLKVTFGGRICSRNFDKQAVELFLPCAALNRMIQLAKPDNYSVEA